MPASTRKGRKTSVCVVYSSTGLHIKKWNSMFRLLNFHIFGVVGFVFEDKRSRVTETVT